MFIILSHLIVFFTWLFILILFLLICGIFKAFNCFTDSFWRIFILIFECVGVVLWIITIFQHYMDSYNIFIDFFSQIFYNLSCNSSQ